MSDKTLETLYSENLLSAITTPANLLFYVVDLDEPVANDQDKGMALTLLDNRYLLGSNNLSDLDSVATARTNLGLSAGAAVADATGAGDVVTQLNLLLSRVRTLGLIAT